MNSVNPDHERATEIKRNEIFKATSFLNEALRLPGEVDPAAGIELSRTIALAFLHVVAGDGVEEFFANLISEMDVVDGDESVQAIAHFVLQAFGEASGMNTTSLSGKQSLLTTASVLGPDNLESLRKNVAFMIRVEGFQ